ncbi:MAG: hypothetical protein ACKOCW_05520 [Planctomycetaceae bacterium]
MEISFERPGHRFIDYQQPAGAADQKSVHDKLGIQGRVEKIDKIYGFSPINRIFRIVFSHSQGVGFPLPFAGRAFGPVPE